MPAINIDSIVSGILKLDDDDAKSEINIAVFVDESTTAALRDAARRLLVPATEDVRMHIESYFDDPLVVDERADVALILANASPWTGAIYAIARSREIPTVVMTDRLGAVLEHSEATRFPIDHGDLIAPEVLSARIPLFSAAGEVLSDLASRAQDALTTVATTLEGAINAVGREIPRRIIGRALLPEDVAFSRRGGAGTRGGAGDYEALFEELGDWVVRNCPDVRDVFVAAYPFALKAKVDSLIRNAAFQNAVTAAIFFTPGADFPLMTFNELRLLIQVEWVHGFGIDRRLAGEAAGVLAFAFAARCVARALSKPFPLLAWAVKTLCAYATTRLLGILIESYVEAGRELPAPIAAALEQVSTLVRRALPGGADAAAADEATGLEG